MLILVNLFNNHRFWFCQNRIFPHCLMWKCSGATHSLDLLLHWCLPPPPCPPHPTHPPNTGWIKTLLHIKPKSNGSVKAVNKSLFGLAENSSSSLSSNIPLVVRLVISQPQSLTVTCITGRPNLIQKSILWEFVSLKHCRYFLHL